MPLRHLHLLYALSGLLSLGYQVVWLRHFVDRFGSSTLTFALVVSAFIGGLGIGALASPRLGPLLQRLVRGGPLRAYGLVEALVTVTALSVLVERLVPLTLLGTFPYELKGSVYEPTLALQLLKAPLAFLAVFVPCFFMGVSFPLLCRAFARRTELPASLYAWNTLGACSAVLLCEWVLIRWLGHDLTLYLLVAGNAILAAAFLARGDAWQARWEDEPVPPPRRPAPARALAEAPPVSLGVLLAGAAISGFLAGGLEADAFRRVHFIQVFNGAAMSFVSFWAILGIFLGSWTIHRRPQWTLRRVQVLFASSFLVFLAVTRFALLPLRVQLERLINGVADVVPFDPDGRFVMLAAVLALTGVIVLPAFYLVSLLLPWICNAAQRQGRHLGPIYGLNTVAFLAGMVAFSWIAPRVNAFYSFELFTWIFALLAAALVWMGERRPLGRLRPVAVALGIAAVVWFTPRGFAPSYLPANNPLRLHGILEMRGSSGWTTFVSAQPGGNALYLDTAKMSDVNPEVKRYMKVMAHLPLLSVDDPKSALLICFGVGNTAAAIAKHSSLERIDIVDLERNMFEHAPLFAFHNDRVYEDPRVRLIHDDGRSFLRLTQGRYDLITSEPPPPLMHGIERLYSREYYRDVLEHLTDQGCMSQWLPIYQMPPAAGRLIVRTFVQSFPHSVLVTGTNKELLLIGSKRPIDWRNVVLRVAQEPAAAGDLADVDVPSGEHLLARLVMTHAELLAEYGTGEVLTDQKNPLSSYWPTGRMETFPFSATAALAVFPPDLLAERPRIGTWFGDLRALLTAVPDFPVESFVPLRGRASLPGSEVDWLALQELNLEADALLRRGRVNEGLDAYRRSVAQVPAQLGVHMALGQFALARNEPQRALAPLEELTRHFPDFLRPRLLLALVQARAGRTEAALATLRIALELNPYSYDAHLMLGDLLEATQGAGAGREHLRRASSLKPMDEGLRRRLGDRP